MLGFHRRVFLGSTLQLDLHAHTMVHECETNSQSAVFRFQECNRNLTGSRAVVVHTFNLSTQEAETGGVCEFEANLVYKSEFQDSSCD